MFIRTKTYTVSSFQSMLSLDIAEIMLCRFALQATSQFVHLNYFFSHSSTVSRCIVLSREEEQINS